MAERARRRETDVMEQVDGLENGTGGKRAISDEEIRAAKRAWLLERDLGEASSGPGAEALFARYRALISLQAQQIAEDFRRKRPTS